MKSITVELADRSYPIVFCPGLVTGADGSEQALLASEMGDSVFIVSNETVAGLYLEPLKRLLGDRKSDVYIMPDGEMYKTLDQIQAIIGELLAAGHTRETTLIALGGGVVGDITGFAAAVYQRGVAVIQIPTTLLSQVDSSVGGKTAVNHPLGKNMIGAFHQPKMVVMDVETLKTLSAREFSAGLAEIVKHAALADRDYFHWLQANQDSIMARDSACLMTMIEWSCRIKAVIVASDEKEQGNRALLNLGHTFGHAIETLSGYGTVLHGEAVAMGLMMAADYSVRSRTLVESAPAQMAQLLTAFSLPTAVPKGLIRATFLQAMGRDKKATVEGLRLVILRDIGQAEVTSQIDEDALEETVAYFLDSA
mgnify:FL=1